MADPLSISASIIAVLQFTSTVIGYISEVSTAPKDRQRVLLEVRSTQAILSALRDLGENAGWTGSWTLTVKSLNVPGGPLEQFKTALERLALKLKPVEGWKMARKALAWPLQKEEVNEILRLIERQKTLFSLALQNDHIFLSQMIQKEVESLHDKIDSTATGIAELQINQKDQKNLNILSWLSPLEFRSQQMDLIRRRHDRTGMWLINSHEFEDWQNGSCKTLFCPGIPGAGKTLLASIVINHLLNTFRNENIGIAYVFCNYQSQGKQTPLAVFSSLLEQMLIQRDSIPDNLQRLYDHHISRRTRPTFDDVFNLLRSEIRTFDQTFVVVDALDEYNNDNGIQKYMVHRLLELQELSKMNLLVTSRFAHQIESYFQQAAQVEIRADGEDVRRYIRGNTHLLATKPSESLEEAIVGGITQVVDGMFLLAQLHLDSLKSKTSAKAIKTALKMLPKGANALDSTYDQVIERINAQNPDFKSLAEQTLSWITYAQRPLSLYELQHALAVEPNESELDEENIPHIELIVSVCAGLVTVDQESNVIRLVHYTTQEYFERTRSTLFPNAQKDIGRCCLTYLTYDVFSAGPCQSDQKFESRLRKFRLLEYAACYWANHIHGELEHSLEDLIFRFLMDEVKIACAVQAMLTSGYRYYGYSQVFAKNVLALHLCANFGLERITAKLLDYQLTKHSKDSKGRTPLSWAAGRGHKTVVEMLAVRDDVEVDSKDRWGWTPLSWAARGGHETVVGMLAVRDDVDADSKDDNGQSPLSWAAETGHEAVVGMLAVRDDVDADSKDEDGRTPLSWAAGNGHEAVVEMLAARDDVDVDSKDDGGRTPLSWAAEIGHEAVVKLLELHISRH